MRQARTFILMLLLSIGLLAFIVYLVGYRQTIEKVREAGFSAFGIVGFVTLIYLLLQAWALELLNRPIGHRIRFATLIEASVVGFAGNMLSPISFLGGEPLKVIYAARVSGHPHHQVAGTVVLAKYLEGISLVFFFTVSAIVATITYRQTLFVHYPSVGITIAVVQLLFVILIIAILMTLIKRWHPFTRVLRIIFTIKFLAKRMTKVVDKTAAMEDQISRVFREHGRAAWQSFAAQIVCHVIIFVKPALFFALGASAFRLNFGELCFLFIAIQVFLSVQLTPLGAGTLDAGVLLAISVLSLQKDAFPQLIAFLLCLRFWEIILIGLGAWFAAKAGTQLLNARLSSGSADPPTATAP